MRARKSRKIPVELKNNGSFPVALNSHPVAIEIRNLRMISRQQLLCIVVNLGIILWQLFGYKNHVSNIVVHGAVRKTLRFVLQKVTFLLFLSYHVGTTLDLRELLIYGEGIPKALVETIKSLIN